MPQGDQRQRPRPGSVAHSPRPQTHQCDKAQDRLPKSKYNAPDQKLRTTSTTERHYHGDAECHDGDDVSAHDDHDDDDAGDPLLLLCYDCDDDGELLLVSQ